MSRPPREGLQGEILAVSQRLFGTVGFRGTSLQMVADEVGCSKAALLYHFRTKAAILDALVAGLSHDLERMIAQLEETPQEHRVSRALQLSVALIVRHREPLAAVRGLDDLAEISAVITHSQELAVAARDILTGPDPDPTRQAAVLTLEHGLLGACLELPHLDDQQLAAALVEIGARILEVDPDEVPVDLLDPLPVATG